jgi:hypothetical protein
MIDATSDGKGNIYVLDSISVSVQKFSPDGERMCVVGGKRSGPEALNRPFAVQRSGLFPAKGRCEPED